MPSGILINHRPMNCILQFNFFGAFTFYFYRLLLYFELLPLTSITILSGLCRIQLLDIQGSC